jgi:hypothetical protein
LPSGLFALSFPSGLSSCIVSGVKTEPVSFYPPELRTHFPFEVNHVEVYNNIKFPFTRFVGSALFLRQKTHSLPNNTVYLSYVTSTTTFYEMRMTFFLFILIFGSHDNINSNFLLLNDSLVVRTFIICCYL